MRRYIGDLWSVTVLFIGLGSIGHSALGQASDDAYMSSISAYATSIKAYSFEATYVGESHREVEGYGTVPYQVRGAYKALADTTKGLWKLEIREERSPQGEMSGDEFKALYVRESRTINKTRDGTVEYLHDDLEFGNYAVLYGQHQDRDYAYRFHMQTLDPIGYVMQATRNEGCDLLDVTQQDNGDVIITYGVKKAEGMMKRVELSREYSLLPVRISAIGNDGTAKTDIVLKYVQGPNGPVVRTVGYHSKSGSGNIEYTSAKYNPEIQEADFEVEIPFGAMVLDHEGRILVDHFSPDMAVAEILDKGVDEFSEGAERETADSRPGAERDGDRQGERVAQARSVDSGPVSGGGHYGMWIAAAVLLCVVGGLVLRGLLRRNQVGKA